nr:unnamed protein product [Digitaria exilis]
MGSYSPSRSTAAWSDWISRSASSAFSDLVSCQIPTAALTTWMRKMTSGSMTADNVISPAEKEWMRKMTCGSMTADNVSSPAEEEGERGAVPGAELHVVHRVEVARGGGEREEE